MEVNDRKQRAWVEAGILPLNYSRIKTVSTQYLLRKEDGTVAWDSPVGNPMLSSPSTLRSLHAHYTTP